MQLTGVSTTDRGEFLLVYGHETVHSPPSSLESKTTANVFEGPETLPSTRSDSPSFSESVSVAV